jgi:predicted nucleotidyltransferase
MKRQKIAYMPNCSVRVEMAISKGSLVEQSEPHKWKESSEVMDRVTEGVAECVKG